MAERYFDFMKIKTIGFFVSVVFVVISFLSFFSNGLSFSMDFVGGILFDITTGVGVGEISKVLQQNDFKILDVQKNDNGFKFRVLQNKQRQDIIANDVKTILSKIFNNGIVYNRVDFLGTKMGSNFIMNIALSSFLSLSVVFIYIWFRFGWNFAVGIVATLIHNIVILFGIYSIFKINLDLVSSTITILITLFYSLNNSIMVYERIREFMQKHKEKSLTNIINISLISMLKQILLITFVILFCILILNFSGTENIGKFSLITFFSLIISVYSLFFISTPILLYIKDK